MRLDSLFYGLTYRFGKPRWDTDQPQPELQRLAASQAPGRVLDLGCGTGTNGVYLARHGWQVVGIDFIPAAVASARRKAKAAGAGATFVVGDASRLRESGVEGPFDMVIDIGCYHAIPEHRRDAYAAGVAAVTGPGAVLYLAGISKPPATWRVLGASGVTAGELRSRFGPSFELVDETPDGSSGFVTYRLVRRMP